MGASTFITTGSGKTAKEAFLRAREDAQYEHGHGGYTGTLAEKDRFVMFPDKPATLEEGYDLADKYNCDDPRVEDKWGPAGCMQVEGDSPEPTFIFFGWASD